MNDIKSPYSAAITGGGFLLEETNILLPLLQSPDRADLLKDEKVNNRLLHINSEKSRDRSVAEIVRRYDAMPLSFWESYAQLPDEDKPLAILLVILKTYKICFDFHVNVTMRKWNSVSKSVTLEDLMMEFNELSAKDEFVASWSEATQKKVASAYLTILRKVNMLDRDNSLQSVRSGNMGFYIEIGEPWFLEACLLQPYEIEAIRSEMA